MRRSRVILLGITLSAVVAIIVALTPLALTYSGYCKSKSRWLSDEEKIHAAVVRVVQSQRRQLWRLTGNYYQGWTPEIIKYTSIDEFLAANGNCCGFGPLPGDDVEWPTFASRLFGSLTDVVVVHYVERQIDEDGQIVRVPVRRQVELNVCGQAVD